MTTQAAFNFGNKTIRERFERFHGEHPEVYTEFVRRVRLAKHKGFRCGARTVWEAMRWTYYVERDSEETFKLNDHYPPHYARLAMSQEPDLAGFFEIRELRAE